MPLTPGTRLGPYEILAPLGVGGMGEVYQARDARLHREVAIKTSHAEFTERFESEARAIAALNHPHICQIYDVGPNYLVMELVEGEPLRGPLPANKAVACAGQILDALHAAHKKGITHRDLKPANILVTKAGIKLLDFGLAKVSAPLAQGDVTVTQALTTYGQIAGTLQYMSPEQLHGKDIDTRSDLFSFGCVFYELLTGKPAFEGESAASVIAAILEREPARMASTAPFERLIRRCLAKDPEERWQTARDLKAEMLAAASGPVEVAAATPRTGRRQWVSWGVSLALAGALILSVAMGSRPTAAGVVRFTLTPTGNALFSPTPNTSVPVPQFALSPDGSTIAFTATPDGGKSLIWVRPMVDATAHPLAGTESGSLPFWSPDGKWIGYFADQQLRKIPAEGGPSQLITESPSSDLFGASWGADDTILFACGSLGLFRVSASGGPAVPATTLNPSHGDVSHRWPVFLPDGRHFLYYVRALPEFRGIYTGGVESGPDKLLLKTESDGAYAAPGYVLDVEGDLLMARPFDAGRLALTGSGFAVQTGVARASTAHGAFSVSRTGVLAYSTALLHRGQLTWFDRQGNAAGTVGGEGNSVDFRLSPDEQRLVMSVVDPKTSNPDLWLADLARGNLSRFTFGPVLNSSALWSPDGGTLVYRVNHQGSAIELYEQSANGGGQERPVLTFDGARAVGIRSFAYVPTDWSQDGHSILMSVPSPATGFDIWNLPVHSDGKPTPLIQGPGDQVQGNLSSDGRLVAYASNESGRFEIYVQAIPLGRKWPVSTAGGTEPRWRRDGRELYYLAPDRKLMSVLVSGALTAGLSFSLPQALFQTRVAAQSFIFQTNYVAAASGQKFLVNTQAADGNVTSVTVALNWAAGLKKE